MVNSAEVSTRGPGRPVGSKGQKIPEPRVPDDVGYRRGHVFGMDDLEAGLYDMAEVFGKYTKRLIKDTKTTNDQKIKAVEVYTKLVNVAKGRASGPVGGRPRNPEVAPGDDGHGDKEYLDSMQG